jgi:hypothetical protein
LIASILSGNIANRYLIKTPERISERPPRGGLSVWVDGSIAARSGRATLWQMVRAQAMMALESAKSSPAYAAAAWCRSVLFFSVCALDVAIG